MVISGKTACFCLERLFTGAARFTCAPASDHLETDAVSLEQVIDWARQRGLDAKLSHLSWGELRDAISATPVLLILTNGNSVLALRNGDSVEEIVVADPLYEDGQEFLLPRHLLEPAWGGEAIISLPVPVQRKYKARLLVSGLGLCTAALTLGLAFTATDLQKVVRSFAVSANLLANSDMEAEDHVAENSSTEDIASLALKGSENPDKASLKAELDTQTGFKAGVSLSAAIEPDAIGSNSARPGSDVSIVASSTSNSDMHPDSVNQHLMPKPQDNGTSAASEVLSRDTQERGPTPETGPEPQVTLAPTELDSATKPAGVEQGHPGPSNAADASVSRRFEANTETSSTEIEVDELHHDTAGSESTNLSRSADSATSHTPEQPPLSSVESAALISRGDVLMSTGDLTSARQFYERAADHGDGRAALRMGETYDPAFLAQSRLDGARGDALLAARWYLRALELGVPDAAVLFKAVVSADRHSQP